MSEENKALVRRYFEEIWDKGNLDLIDELLTTDFVRHGPTATEGEVRGQEGFEGLVSMYRSALPDLRVSIEDQMPRVRWWLLAGGLAALIRGSLWATLLPAIRRA